MSVPATRRNQMIPPEELIPKVAQAYRGRRYRLREYQETKTMPPELLDILFEGGADELDVGGEIVSRELLTQKFQEDADVVLSDIMKAHSRMMVKTRHQFQGLAFEATFENRRVVLLGVSHMALIENQYDDSKLEIYPQIRAELDKSNLYIEFDLTDQKMFEELLQRTHSRRADIEEAQKSHPSDVRPLGIKESWWILDLCLGKSVTGLDSRCAFYQKEQKKPVYSLESVETQIETHLSMLRSPIDAFWRTAEYAIEAIDAAQWNNLESMTELSELVPDNVVENFAIRNRAMADTIFEKLQANESSVFAVGASHLVGPGSIPEFLRQRGAAVTHWQLEEIPR